VALQGEARPQTKAEAVALQVPRAKRVALEELQAALEVVPAAAPQPRLLVALEELVAALGGVLGLQLQPLLAPQLLLAPQAASSRKAERALAAPLPHIWLLGKPQHTG
jgi:hypothetical protein